MGSRVALGFGSLCFQREALKFSVMRSLAREPALVQEELAGRHGTKLKCGHRGQFFLQPLKVAVRTISLALAWSARPSIATGHREMRTEGMGFLRDAECSRSVIDRGSQTGKLGFGLNADPENARRFRRGKEPIAPNG